MRPCCPHSALTAGVSAECPIGAGRRAAQARSFRAVDLVIEENRAFRYDGLARRDALEYDHALIPHCACNDVSLHEAAGRILDVGVLLGAVGDQSTCSYFDAAEQRVGLKLHLRLRIRIKPTVGVVQANAHRNGVALGIHHGRDHLHLAVDHDAG